MTDILVKFDIWLDSIGFLGGFLRFVMAALWAFLVVSILFRIERAFFAKRFKIHNRIQVRFVENILRIAVILIAVFWVFNTGSTADHFGKVLFQGTAILGAIIGLAAQPVISDLCCGIMISICKPFEIGDRIEFQSGIAGQVKDITIRHVVLQGIGTTDIIIPNSVINSMAVTNLSHGNGIRSLFMRFNIAYGSDVEKALEILHQAVVDSVYAVPAHPEGSGIEYSPAYFMEYAESSLVIGTTVYYEPGTGLGDLKNDINLRIYHAFAEAGIEIPYNYMNVVMHSTKEE
ncbi:MAG: mechanosensitive ion channel family protein [Lachnospiraceae bacterium]|nr:mechanosensitive ion channel family protein [Lachnospiraceae bacterium]